MKGLDPLAELQSFREVSQVRMQVLQHDTSSKDAAEQH
jgi:hypothetical protein